ncbi:MAG: metallophosphoesterase family protein [Pirellulaceae bacterium]|nr:metallophosphoesterase family protein [Pirellulaceae bacterium]
MKLLLASDLHCDQRAARRLVDQAARHAVDVAVIAGDLATMRRGLEAIVEVLRGLPCPAVLVAGNSESPDELRRACEAWPEAHVLHGSGITLGGVDFFGLGGAVPVTPFGAWSFDLDESAAGRLLKACPAGGVLVTHSPPAGCVDRNRQGRSLGSQAVRAAIERARPSLVVCGHIHESAGRRELLAGVPVVNAGPKGVRYLYG